MIYFYSTMEVSIKTAYITNDETNESDSLPIMKTSSYYTNHFKPLVNIKINSFGILSTNIQSINAKFNELAAFVQECIQESWLTEQDDLTSNLKTIWEAKFCSFILDTIIKYYNVLKMKSGKNS